MTTSTIDNVNIKRGTGNHPLPSLPTDVRDLLLYRIARLSTISDRTGQLNISRRFGLNLGAWRVLSVIHALAPVTLTTLAGELYLDKGQLSRSISDLIGSGLVRHAAGQLNRRQTLLTLTAAGRRLHDRVLAFVIGRNVRMMQFLSAAERRELFRLLDKVMAAVAESYEELFGSPAKASAEAAIDGNPPRARPVAASKASRPAAVHDARRKSRQSKIRAAAR
jgi:DNA-binding MarR family transcriptional regulator